jgi:hypothetical protein
MLNRKTLCLYLIVLGLLLAPRGLSAQGKAPQKGKAQAAAAPLQVGDILKGIFYRSIGPTRQSGRFVDFAVPAEQPNAFYAATGSGGLWKP